MAGENIISNPRDWGHHKSPFFKLPPEVRNKIYAETFEGSEISLVIEPPLNVAIVPVTGRHSIFNTDKSNHHFLLTCYQVYLEALALYWTSTVARNGCDGHFSRAYFLNRIPANAKRYIQHLRDVNATTMPIYTERRLRGEIIRWSPSLAEFFDEFPNLKSCSIKNYWMDEVQHECDQAKARRPHVHILEKDVSPAMQNHSPVDVYVFDNHTLHKRIRWSQPA